MLHYTSHSTYNTNFKHRLLCSLIRISIIAIRIRNVQHHRGGVTSTWGSLDEIYRRDPLLSCPYPFPSILFKWLPPKVSLA